MRKFLYENVYEPCTYLSQEIVKGGVIRFSIMAESIISVTYIFFAL